MLVYLSCVPIVPDVWSFYQLGFTLSISTEKIYYKDVVKQVLEKQRAKGTEVPQRKHLQEEPPTPEAGAQREEGQCVRIQKLEGTAPGCLVREACQWCWLSGRTQRSGSGSARTFTATGTVGDWYQGLLGCRLGLWGHWQDSSRWEHGPTQHHKADCVWEGGLGTETTAQQLAKSRNLICCVHHVNHCLEFHCTTLAQFIITFMVLDIQASSNEYKLNLY